MKWIRNLFPTADQRIFLAVAEQEFSEVCCSTASAADIYRDHPNAKKQDWKAIRSELMQLTSSSNSSILTRLLRSKFAHVVELLVTDHFYTNLDVEDREYFAKLIGSTREIEDKNYYFSMARDYWFATILETIIFGGWTGSDDSRENLKKLQRAFVDSCKLHCEFKLKTARANGTNTELTHDEKEIGKTMIMLKEVARLALAGEKEP
ncbi:hypothetical protein MGMO_86c00160 [Methyloglobulus morosus KoM1]|uniref:Uncharacterized protein n=1 Tax=Methyloglobulus morosus KoM1 TaxID=1116472 RepID=V5DX01_9GAMM|nr:hypothetical protein [Methyloglobulus morosus]ESS71856.1 hypothetical protein MGMO_86c00160 [Methyloglobulus morosus KoM1]